jgi:tetratricopeptide (TPR) repeat protein
MSSKTPVSRQVNWLFVIPQVGFMILLTVLFNQLDPKNGVLYGVIVYLAVAYILRFTVSSKQRTGMKYVRAKKFKEAIPYFESSYKFFSNNLWVDKFRSITVFSASSVSFREMALNNIAFCYSQFGDGKRAKEYYERTLKEFPESGLARAGLNMLNSANNQDDVS